MKPLTMTGWDELEWREWAAQSNPSWCGRKMLAEIDALRAALTAAESDVKRLNAECEMLNNMLLDEREKLAAAVCRASGEK